MANSKRCSRVFSAAVIAFVAAAAAVPALAQDDCQTDALPINDIILGNTTNSTSDGGDVSSCAQNDTIDDWYTFTPMITGKYQVSLCGSSFDTTLSIWDGCASAGGAELACNDDSVCGKQSQLAFDMSYGTTYYVRVSGFFGDTGAYRLQVTMLPPPNDDCANATVVHAGDTVTGWTVNSNTDGSSSCSIVNDHDAWFSFTPTESGPYKIDTCGSTFDTVLSVHTGCPGDTSNEIACNDDFCGGFNVNSSVTPTLTAGTEYLIRVSGNGGVWGGITLNVSGLLPTNDDCANATLINSVPYTDVGTNANATADGPGLSCSGGPTTIQRSVWYKFQGNDQNMRFTATSLSDLVPIYAVLEGADCATATEVTCFLYGGVPLDFFATSGQTYWLVVGEFDAGGGDYQVDLDFAPPEPANDNCANAEVLMQGVAASGTTAGAAGADIAACGFYTRDVWYAFVPTPNTDYRVMTTGATADLDAAVYFGACPLDASETIACADPIGSDDAWVDFTSDAQGTGVLIRIASFQADEADFDVTVDVPPPPPANDDCANATAINEGSSISGTNIDSTTDGGSTCGSGGYNDVWFSLTPPVSGSYTIDTCGTSYDTILGLYSACPGDTASELTCNDDSCGYQSSITFDLTSGTEYLIRVASYTSDATGSYNLNISAAPSPHGACCVGGVCSSVTEADCTAMGGSYEGDNTTCDPQNNSTLSSPAVPDGTGVGLSDSITVADSIPISSLDVRVDMSSTWCGDVIATLQGPNGAMIDLMNRPGLVGGGCCGDASNMDGSYVFTDSAAQTIDEASLAGDTAYIIPEGNYLPATADDVHTSLTTTFGGTDAMGAWTLTLSDNATGDTTLFRGWELIFNGQPNVSGICSTPPSCPCEADGDAAQVNVFDLLAYLADWFPQNGMTGAGLSADFNNSGNVDVFDLLDYLSCWFPASAGNPCP